MKTVRIKELELENFKCHDHLCLRFSDRGNLISGRSGCGKNTVFDAWCWLLFGKDSRGSTQTEVRPMDGGRVRNVLDLTQVTGLLEVGEGEDSALRQLRRTLRITPEGSLTSDFQVDGIPCRKASYSQAVAEIVPEDLFWVLSHVLMFGEGIPQQDRRAIFCDLMGEESLPGPGRKEELSEALGGDSLLKFRKKLRLQKQDLKNACNDLPFRISEMEGTLRQLGIRSFQDLKGRLTCLQAQRDQLLQEDSPSFRRLSELNSQIEDLCRTLGTETMVESCARRLIDLRKNQEKTLTRISQLRRLTELSDEYVKSTAAHLEEKINGRLRDSGLQVRFSSADGEEHCCELVYGGIPWRNLNRRGKILGGLAAISFLSEGYGICLPLFLEVPGREKIQGLFPGQLILLEPYDLAEELKVEALWQ